MSPFLKNIKIMIKQQTNPKVFTHPSLHKLAQLHVLSYIHSWSQLYQLSLSLHPSQFPLISILDPILNSPHPRPSMCAQPQHYSFPYPKPCVCVSTSIHPSIPISKTSQVISLLDSNHPSLQSKSYTQPLPNPIFIGPNSSSIPNHCMCLCL